jgi:ATP-dependent Lhr-like helicase
VVQLALARLEGAGVLVRGALLPSSLGGTGDEWCDPEVLRTLRRRSLAALRAEVEPVEPESLGVFLPRWHGVGVRAGGAGATGGAARGADGLLRAVEQLSGAAVPASALETLVLPARVADYSPGLLDELTTAGEVLWCGHGRLPGSGGGDGMVSLHLADGAPLTLRDPDPVAADGPLDSDLHRAVLDLLTGSGGFFLPRLAELAGASQATALDVVWDLVWAGEVTNDTYAPVRALVQGGGRSSTPSRTLRRRSSRRWRWSRVSKNSTRLSFAGRTNSSRVISASSGKRRCHTSACQACWLAWSASRDLMAGSSMDDVHPPITSKARISAQA